MEGHFLRLFFPISGVLPWDLNCKTMIVLSIPLHSPTEGDILQLALGSVFYKQNFFGPSSNSLGI